MMKKTMSILVLSVLALGMFAGIAGTSRAANDAGMSIRFGTVQTSAMSNPIVTMEVQSFGTIKIEMALDVSPVTAGNFINLTQQGFYDGLIFHRVVAGFVIQGGDPTGTGSGGSGTNIPWEDTGLKNNQYTIAMARAGNPNNQADSGTASSQFFINLVNNPSLDGYTYPYVVFGNVTEGTSVVDAIGVVPVGYGDKPLTDVVMTSVTVSGLAPEFFFTATAIMVPAVLLTALVVLRRKRNRD